MMNMLLMEALIGELKELLHLLKTKDNAEVAGHFPLPVSVKVLTKFIKEL